jgi:uncharacterized protein
MRVVLDTHVVLEAILWQSPRHAILRAAQSRGEISFLASPETLEEWRRVLTYPVFQLSPEQQTAAIKAFVATTVQTPLAMYPDSLPRCSDPHDQKFLVLAYSGDANFLLTRDKKLRKIGRNRKYRERFSTITPEHWLALHGEILKDAPSSNSSTNNPNLERHDA